MKISKKIAATCIFVFAVAGSGWAGIDFNLNVNIGGPEIEFVETPAVVLAAPGVYVVPDYPYEVFFVGGVYWSLHGKHWYRCAGPRKKWVRVETKRVPAAIVRIPRGKYKHWHPGRGDDKVKIKVKNKHKHD